MRKSFSFITKLDSHSITGFIIKKISEKHKKSNLYFINISNHKIFYLFHLQIYLKSKILIMTQFTVLFKHKFHSKLAVPWRKSFRKQDLGEESDQQLLHKDDCNNILFFSWLYGQVNACELEENKTLIVRS